jgi:hypothetical protein
LTIKRSNFCILASKYIVVQHFTTHMFKQALSDHTFAKSLLVFIVTAFLFVGCKNESVKPAAVTKTVPDTTKTPVATTDGTPFNNMLGVNTYPWDFLQNPSDPSNVSSIYQPKMNLIKSFSQVRHYLDWNYLEDAQNSYTYNPVNSGSWNLDAIAGCVADNITSLVDIKCCPNWFLASYPASMQDAENVPAPYRSNLNAPASYIDQAKVAFQFAARYGSNAGVNKSLLSVNTTPRWTDDPINVIKVGLNTVKYIECDNERDKWWKGPATIQTAAEYAANMSAFYDGDMGKLGKNVGVKTADPNMIVVMGGLAKGDTTWVRDMINWCITHRGYKADGSINLCFDVINYHYYNFNAAGTAAKAPEQSGADTTADAMVRVAKSLKNPPEVWITESGYDINPGSPLHAPVIGSKSAENVQADWILRTALLYIKHDIKRLFFYQLFDDTPGDPQQFATSGLAQNTSRRPAADYILETKNLMGNYIYQKTICSRPMVDVYVNGTKTIYALYMPTAQGLTAPYSLNVGSTSATVYTLNPASPTITSTVKKTTAGVLKVTVGETPMFVSN